MERRPTPMHLTSDLLNALWTRALPEARLAELQEHVDGCSACRLRLDALRSATVPQSRPQRVSDEDLDAVKHWLVETTAPRRAEIRVTIERKLGRIAAEIVRAFEMYPTRSMGSIDEMFARRSHEVVGTRRFEREEEALARSYGRQPLRLSDGRRVLLFRTTVADPHPTLSAVFEQPPDTPVRIRLLGPSGDAETRTLGPGPDPADFRLSPGLHQLIVELDPPWEIEIDVADA